MDRRTEMDGGARSNAVEQSTATVTVRLTEQQVELLERLRAERSVHTIEEVIVALLRERRRSGGEA
jgi:hypothetical protein